MRKIVMLLLIFVLLVIPVQAAEEEAPPSYTNASVHDPSVIFANNQFYVFGSHLAAAKTPDLMNWELIEGDGVTPANSLFNDVTVELEEALSWAQSDTLWAPDVIKLKKDGKYYMYYNACEGSSPRSAMGIAVSDSVDGPYEDLGLILRSGMTEEESATIDGTPYDDQHYPEVYDATKQPNVVDPDVFYDEDGKLWMVYGSYSGGIFILELDPETGFPKEGQGYGKKLLGGNHSRIEAPYIVYNEQTDYYYLYLSYGGLASDGGYNVRVARSENPDGPYTDIQGNQMIDVKGQEGTFYDDESIAPTGTKLIGNHLFKKNFGESGNPTGYKSPGHNSVYVDEETGEQYLIFHTRFPSRGETHEIRVHQIFMNEQGWPVVAPFRYSEESLASVTEEELAGSYKFINYSSEIGNVIDESVPIELNEDHSISGDVNGTWNLDGSNITLTVENNSYQGVVLKQWDPVAQKESITFTTVVGNGLSAWGAKSAVSQFSDQEIVDIVAGDLTIDNADNIMKDLTLPKEGEQGVTISWESSNQEVVNNDGEIQRPAFGEAPIAVTLTAHLKKGEASQEKAFELTVLPETFKGLVAHYNFEDNLSDSTGNVEDGTLTGNRLNNTGGTIDFVEGQSGKAAKFDGESGVKLPDGLINSYSYSVALWLKPSDLSGYTTSFFGASANNSWVSLLPNGFGDETLLWSGEEWFDGSTGMQIPLDEWSHVVFTVDQGALTIYINGEKVSEMPKFPDVFTKLDAEFGLGVNYWDTPFQGLMDEVYIYNNQVLSQDQVTNYLAEGTFELSTSNNGDDETEEEGTDEGTTEEENEEETVTEDTSQDEEEGQDSNKNNSTEEEAATPTDDEKEHSLPDTATGMYSWMLAGIGLLCIGATAYLVTRRKRNES